MQVHRYVDRFYHFIIISDFFSKNIFFFQVLKSKLQSALEVANYAKENILEHLPKNIPARVDISEAERFGDFSFTFFTNSFSFLYTICFCQLSFSFIDSLAIIFYLHFFSDSIFLKIL